MYWQYSYLTKTRNTGHLGAFDMIKTKVATSVTSTLGKHDSPLQTNIFCLGSFLMWNHERPRQYGHKPEMQIRVHHENSACTNLIDTDLVLQSHNFLD